MNIIHYCKIKPGYKTDHFICDLNISFLHNNRGPGYFKINNNILLEKEYQEIIKESIQETVLINTDAYPNTLWKIKGSIRNQTIKYGSYKKE